jgi:hypothetical protein
MIDCCIMFVEVKEKVKDVASKGVESAKEAASKAADKGRGKKLTRFICVLLLTLCVYCRC